MLSSGNAGPYFELMYIIVWEYQVKADERSRFEEAYSPAGAWAELFRKGFGYLGSELLSDESNDRRYLTIDHWISKDAYETFLTQHGREYKSLDERCEKLTASESLIGKWETTQRLGKSDPRKTWGK